MMFQTLLVQKIPIDKSSNRRWSVGFHFVDGPDLLLRLLLFKELIWFMIAQLGYFQI